MAQKILIADDSISMRSTISMALMASGYDYHEVTNGQEALQSLQQADNAFALLITDINMPQINGLELIKKIRKEISLRYLPIMVLTTERESEMKKMAQELQVTAWLNKPFDGQNLVKLVSRLIGSA